IDQRPHLAAGRHPQRRRGGGQRLVILRVWESPMHGLIRRLRGGVVLLALAAGCSSKPQMAQLSGTVTFKGQPVPAGWISFTPEAGKGSVKVCQIKDGVYDSSKEPDPGIFPGRNLIRIGGFDGK